MLAPDTGEVRSYTVPDQGNLGNIAVDGSGNVFGVGGRGSVWWVWALNTGTGAVNRLPFPESGAEYHVAVGPSGEVYAASGCKAVDGKFLHTDWIWKLEVGASQPVKIPLALRCPKLLAADSAGNLYVLNSDAPPTLRMVPKGWTDSLTLPMRHLREIHAALDTRPALELYQEAQHYLALARGAQRALGPARAWRDPLMALGAQTHSFDMNQRRVLVDHVGGAEPMRLHADRVVNSAGETVEEDARWVRELAIGPDGKTTMPALIVVRIVCIATAMCLGLGFALGGETGAAYRMARFCMEVGKDFFCWLFGITISKEDWPSEGAVEDVVTDRGAGQAQTAKPNDGYDGPVMREMPPTGFGQGKPNVEGTHARHIKIADRPTHVVTKIPLVHLVRREIRNEIRRMHSASTERRLGPTLIMAVDNLTCVELYEKLRTGPLEPGPRVVRLRPTRNVLGQVLAPARAWLTSAGAPAAAPDGLVSIPVPGAASAVWT